MDNELKDKFETYLNEINIEKITSVWKKQSEYFRDFWNTRIMNEKSEPLSDSEIDEIVLILDIHAKGSTFNEN